jgi:hypothetical protein
MLSHVEANAAAETHAGSANPRVSPGTGSKKRYLSCRPEYRVRECRFGLSTDQFHDFLDSPGSTSSYRATLRQGLRPQQRACFLAQLAFWPPRHEDDRLRLAEQFECHWRVQPLVEMSSKGLGFRFWNELHDQPLRERCDRDGDPLSPRSTQLSVPADRRGCGTAHVGTPRRGRSHVCSTHQRARTPTKMSQSIVSVLHAYCMSHKKRNRFGELDRCL